MMYRHHALTEREKAHMRRVNQIKQSHSKASTLDAVAPVKKVREYLAPVKSSYVPTVRGWSGCKLSPAKRLKLQEKVAARRAFFAELGVSV